MLLDLLNIDAEAYFQIVQVLFYKGKVFDFIRQGEKEKKEREAKKPVKEPKEKKEEGEGEEDEDEEEEDDEETLLSHNDIL